MNILYKKYISKNGAVYIPEAYCVLNPEKAEDAIVVYVIEVYDGDKNGVPHMIYFSNDAADPIDIVTIVKKTYPILTAKDVLWNTPYGLKVEPYIGVYKVHEIVNETSLPDGVVMVRSVI